MPSRRSFSPGTWVTGRRPVPATLFLHNGLINEDGVRKTAFTAYQTMIAKVDLFTSVVRLADGVYCYSCASHNPVYVLWCDSGTCALSVPVTGRARVTDYLGHQTMRQIAGVVTTSIPVYVESVPVGTSVPGGPSGH